MTQVHHAGGTDLAEVYLLNVYLLNGVRYEAIKATKGKLPTGIQALIGMDIITSGDFCISNLNGKTVMSFRFPSFARTDYVAEQNRAAIKHRHSSRKDKKKKR